MVCNNVVMLLFLHHLRNFHFTYLFIRNNVRLFKNIKSIEEYFYNIIKVLKHLFIGFYKDQYKDVTFSFGQQQLN